MVYGLNNQSLTNNTREKARLNPHETHPPNVLDPTLLHHHEIDASYKAIWCAYSLAHTMTTSTTPKISSKASQASTDIAWSVADPMWSEPRHGMRAQVAHRVELVRHGESNANKMLTEDGDIFNVQDPTLTKCGHQQADNVGRLYERLTLNSGTAAAATHPGVRIETSNLQRAIATSLPTQSVFESATVVMDTNLRERWTKKTCLVQSCDSDGQSRPTQWLYPNESGKEFQTRVHTVIRGWKARGTAAKRAHTIVFTHSQLISAVLTHLIPVADHETDSPQFFHIPNGSITVLDFDTEGKMHVHCVGHTEHLQHPTGQHTAHVDSCRKSLERSARPIAPGPSQCPPPDHVLQIDPECANFD